MMEVMEVIGGERADGADASAIHHQ
jgi:hypothetical protein